MSTNTKAKDTFKIQFCNVDVEGRDYKRYKSSQGPANAARKAARRIFGENSEARKKGTIRIGMRKTTQGSDGKTYIYDATRKEYETPKTREVNGKSIENRYYITLQPVQQKKKE